MKRTILALGGFLLLNACTSEKPISEKDRMFRRDGKEILAEIDTMLDNDQAIRHMLSYGTADTNSIDSMVKQWAAKGIDLDSLLFVNDTLLVKGSQKDSLLRVMAAMDELHTQKMVHWLSVYGYPSSARIDPKLGIDPFLILHHPSPKFRDTLISLLQTELREKRLDTISHAMLSWDLAGREGLPQIPGMKVQKNADGTTTIEL